MAAQDSASPISGFTLASADGSQLLQLFDVGNWILGVFFLSPVSRISFSATSNHSQQINHAAGTWKEQPGNSKQKTKQNCPSNLQGHQDLRQLTVGKPSWRPALCRRACWKEQRGLHFCWLALPRSPGLNPERLNWDMWSGGFWPGPHSSLQP